MSPRLEIDATEVEDFSAIPAGNYPAKVVEIEDIADGPKAQYIPIVFQITDGEFLNRKLWRNYVIEGKGLFGLVDLVNTLLGAGTLEAGSVGELDTDDLLDQPCNILVNEYEYPEDSGEMRNDIKKVLSA